MQICKNCQTENPDQAKFCKRCGQSLLVIICLNCHKENEQDALFCQECGKSLVDLRKVENKSSQNTNTKKNFTGNFEYNEIIGSKLHLEINFYDIYNASIRVTSSINQYIYGELVLFISYTLRMLDDLQGDGIPLARILSSAGLASLSGLTGGEFLFYVPLLAASGEDLKEIFKYSECIRTDQARSFLSEDDYINKNWPVIAKLVESRDYSAPQRFIAEITIKKGRVVFYLYPKGFGFLGGNMRNELPSALSVILLRKHFITYYQDKSLFNPFNEAARLCGEAFLHSPITIRKQMVWPRRIANEVLGKMK